MQAKGRRAIAVTGDVGRRDQMEPAIATAWDTLGPIDILVNNAGIETIVPFLELTDDQWTRLVDTNLRGAWLCSQIVCRRVVEAKRAGEHRQHRLDPGGQGAARAARTTRRPSSGWKR